MKRFVLSAMLLGSFCAMNAMSETLSGFIGDSQCKHSGSTAKDVACSKACIEKKGADAVLVSDGKVLKFDDASQAKAKEMAGEKVTIDGTVSGDTVTINSIKKDSAT